MPRFLDTEMNGNGSRFLTLSEMFEGAAFTKGVVAQTNCSGISAVELDAEIPFMRDPLSPAASVVKASQTILPDANLHFSRVFEE